MVVFPRLDSEVSFFKQFPQPDILRILTARRCRSSTRCSRPTFLGCLRPGGSSRIGSMKHQLPGLKSLEKSATSSPLFILICSLRPFVQPDVVEHAHEYSTVWKMFRRGIPLRVHGEFLHPAKPFHGSVPWVDVLNDSCWLSRNPICLRSVTSFKKVICLVLQNFASNVLGSVAETPYRIREYVDMRRVNVVCFFLKGQNCSPSFLKQPLDRQFFVKVPYIFAPSISSWLLPSRGKRP